MLEPRLPSPTVNFVDEYCAAYQTLFPQVRSFEAFKYLHLGMISDIKRKSLPAIAKVVGLDAGAISAPFFNRIPLGVQRT
jgi:SRSO17 transposase